MHTPDLHTLRKQLDEGSTDALTLLDQALAAARSPRCAHAFVSIDEQGARTAAAAPAGALAGLPISVKDLYDIAGQVTSAGSVVLADQPPAPVDAPAVARLRAAGAALIGRTQMTEFAFSGVGINPHHGTPANPWDRATRRIPGGSSSGAAVSVTDGMAVVGIGSDTGGSVRIPSALCGLTGFKPTQRRVPIDGTVPLSTSLDSIGPLAASVRCCAIVDAVLAGEQPTVPALRDVAGARLAIPETLVLNDVDDTVAAAFERACATLQQAGARLQRIAVPEFAELGRLHARGTLAGAEAWAWHRQLLTERGDEYDPRVGLRLRGGEAMGAADYIDLLAARRRWIAQVEARIAPFDALLMPTVPIVAPRIDELVASDAAYFAANGLILRNPTLINFLDGCALSLPCHARGEAPAGLTLAAAGGRDRAVLALGLGVERTLRGVTGMDTPL